MMQTENAEGLRTRLPVIPSLDGLRAIAVLWVILHNVGPAAELVPTHFLHTLLLVVMDMGWLGVQLFFVLSGYLITRILLAQQGAGYWSTLRHFYLRRTIRIFPIYYVVLAFIFIWVFVAAAPPAWLTGPYDHWWWYALYLHNWVHPYISDNGLGHFWSLAVEEQFYLVWPVLVLLLPQRFFPLLCGLLCLLALATRAYVLVSHPEVAEDAAYVWTFARIDALALGAAVAYLTQDGKARMGKVGLVMLLACVLYLLLALWSEHRYMAVSTLPWVANQTVAALLFALLIYGLVVEDREPKVVWSLLCWSARNPLLRAIGRYSYAIYIFHLPLKKLWLSSTLAVVRPGFEQGSVERLLSDVAVVLVVSIGLAALSWRLVEKPFLALVPSQVHR